MPISNMATKWFKKKVFCNTEQLWVQKIIEADDEIDYCPNNNTHTIVTGSCTTISTLASNVVKVQEEATNSDTSGFYSVNGRAFTVQGGETKYDAFLPNIPISILRGHFVSRPDLEGDIINAYVLPQNANTVGYCTANIDDGATVIHVSFTVTMMIEINKLARVVFHESATGRNSNKVQIIDLDRANNTITVTPAINTEDSQPLQAAFGILVQLDTNIIGYTLAPNNTDQLWITIATPVWKEVKRGRFLTLFQHNMNYSEERMIVDTDQANNRVKMEHPFNISTTPSAESPIYVQLSIKTVNNLELDMNTQLDIGAGTIGGSYIDLGSVLCVVYTRNGSTPARVRYHYERLY